MGVPSLYTLTHRERKVIESKGVDAEPVGPNIGLTPRIARRLVPLLETFGCHEFPRASVRQNLIHVLLVEDLRGAKVGNLGHRVTIDEYVLWFDVQMHDFFVVEVDETA